MIEQAALNQNEESDDFIHRFLSLITGCDWQLSRLHSGNEKRPECATVTLEPRITFFENKYRITSVIRENLGEY